VTASETPSAEAGCRGYEVTKARPRETGYEAAPLPGTAPLRSAERRSRSSLGGCPAGMGPPDSGVGTRQRQSRRRTGRAPAPETAANATSRFGAGPNRSPVPEALGDRCRSSPAGGPGAARRCAAAAPLARPCRPRPAAGPGAGRARTSLPPPPAPPRTRGHQASRARLLTGRCHHCQRQRPLVRIHTRHQLYNPEPPVLCPIRPASVPSHASRRHQPVRPCVPRNAGPDRGVPAGRGLARRAVVTPRRRRRRTPCCRARRWRRRVPRGRRCS